MIQIVRHRNRGTTYTIVGQATAQVSTTPIIEGQKVTVYRSEDGRLWTRGTEEFNDGRFEDATPKRQWWPSIYADEVMPPGTFSPDDWILARHKDAWVLAPKNRDDARNYGILLVRNGDEVKFTWNEPRGRDQMLVYPDGSWSLECGEPEDWTDVSDAYDFENSGRCLDEFACDQRDFHELKDGDEPIGIDVVFVKWGDTRLRFECNVLAAHFVPANEGGQEALAKGDCGSCDQAGDTPPTLTRPFDLALHLRRQRAFSERTFGPGARTKGVVDHIRKELREIEANPTDIMEWVDVIILAFDGAWRAGWEPDAIIAAIVEKQTRNEARTWPDWRTADPNAAIEHVRTGGEV